MLWTYIWAIFKCQAFHRRHIISALCKYSTYYLFKPFLFEKKHIFAPWIIPILDIEHSILDCSARSRGGVSPLRRSPWMYICILKVSRFAGHSIPLPFVCTHKRKRIPTFIWAGSRSSATEVVTFQPSMPLCYDVFLLLLSSNELMSGSSLGLNDSWDRIDVYILYNR